MGPLWGHNGLGGRHGNCSLHSRNLEHLTNVPIPTLLCVCDYWDLARYVHIGTSVKGRVPGRVLLGEVVMLEGSVHE